MSRWTFKKYTNARSITKEKVKIRSTVDMVRKERKWSHIKLLSKTTNSIKNVWQTKIGIKNNRTMITNRKQ